MTGYNNMKTSKHINDISNMKTGKHINTIKTHRVKSVVAIYSSISTKSYYMGGVNPCCMRVYMNNCINAALQYLFKNALKLKIIYG